MKWSWRKRCAAWGVAAMLVTMAGCSAPPASRGGFDSPNPASRLYAITRAGREKDRSAIPHLIEALDSDDQAVRMYAINALERITGTRRGYRFYDPPARRHRAIQRWVRAYEAGQFGPESPTNTAAEPSGGVGTAEAQPTGQP